MLIEEWDIQESFWETNPKFLTVPLFRELYESDKSKGKNLTSRQMWGIACLCDYDSMYFNMSEEDRFKMLKPMYFFDIEAPAPNIIETYHKLQKDAERRHIDIWNKKLDEISAYLECTPIDATNAEDIIKVMNGLDKLLSLKDSIEKRLAKTLTKASNRGGGKASLLEQDKLGD